MSVTCCQISSCGPCASSASPAACRVVCPIPLLQQLPRRSRRCCREALSIVAHAQSKDSSCHLPLVVCKADDPLHPLSGNILLPQQCLAPTLLSILSVGLLAAYLLKARIKKPAVVEQPDDDLPVQSVTDPRHHQRVLAKAKQAAHLNNAVAYNKTGEVTKALLELSKALAENSVCRSQAMLTHSKGDMANLYRLHITNTEQPPNFATLLQLQEMLGLSQEEAEKLELEVLCSPGAFAI